MFTGTFTTPAHCGHVWEEMEVWEVARSNLHFVLSIVLYYILQ